MTTLPTGVLPSFMAGEWLQGEGEGLLVRDAVYGQPVTRISAEGLDLAGALEYGRQVAHPALRELSFHDRALRLKALAQHLMEQKEALYELSYKTGTTRRDAWIDIEGGIGTLFSYSSLVRRQLPNETFLLEDDPQPLSRGGTFAGRHLLTSKEGVAVHINAFNFPCWGILEKLAPTLLGGMPAVVKPAPQTAYLAEALVREIVDSGLLPGGALQLVSGDAVDFFPYLHEQDVVSFTGSFETGKKLKTHPNVIDKAVPFTLEADSLNSAILGQTVQPNDEEFKLFIKEVVREMTVKAGQKCTAIRRVLVPKGLTEAVLEALSHNLAEVIIGDPREENVKMGPLVDTVQRGEVATRIERLRASCDLVYSQTDALSLRGGDGEAGGFCAPSLLYCDTPLAASDPHTLEVFGPVATVMPYETLNEAAQITKLGKGSLVSTVVSRDYDEARTLVLATASHHGRLLVLNRDNAKESTGHGSPLPLLVHGGPGRAGGGEELGGTRSIKHYMQRTAVQADPTTLMHIGRDYVRGAQTQESAVHPFRKTFDALEVGDTLLTHRRTVTEADIVNFANVSGDYFYAHIDAVAAQDSIFEKRVAHGYFLVSMAAGLFVHPAPGPVLANYGLENLRFTEPVGIGDTVQARLTVKQKIAKEKRPDDKVASGVVAWDVELRNQDGVTVALYTILTLVERKA